MAIARTITIKIAGKAYQLAGVTEEDEFFIREASRLCNEQLERILTDRHNTLHRMDCMANVMLTTMVANLRLNELLQQTHGQFERLDGMMITALEPSAE